MTHISHSVADPHMKGSTVIHYVADSQVNHMRSVAPTVTRVNSDGWLVLECRRWPTHLRKKMLKVVDPHVRGNNVIHCEADPQVKKMRIVVINKLFEW